MQFMRATYVAYAQQVYGEYREMTPEREWYVAVMMIDGWLNRGYDVGAVARTWNQGNTGPCVRGVNKHNVPYDSCAYQVAVVKNYLAMR